MRESQGQMEKLRAFALSTVLALLIVVLGQGAWATLIAVNLRGAPRVPWSLAAMGAVLWVMWRYLAGDGPPRATATRRRALLRAHPVTRLTFAWTLLAGALSIVALAGYWILMFQLFDMPPNRLPDTSQYPPLTVLALMVMGSLVAPLVEEAAFRGYSQAILERAFAAPLAIFISSLQFASAHLTHGVLLPKLFVYFLGGVMLGVTARLTRSILPGIAVHILLDITFFLAVWPFDAMRRLTSGADFTFWLGVHATQGVAFTVLAALAFGKVAAVARAAGMDAQALRPAVPV
jgi:membrane protease YdiL (CAAX protease family)